MAPRGAFDNQYDDYSSDSAANVLDESGEQVSKYIDLNSFFYIPLTTSWNTVSPTLRTGKIFSTCCFINFIQNINEMLLNQYK